MRNFFKKIALLCGILAIVSITFSFTSPTPVSARDIGECDYLLGMTNWDCHFKSDMSSESDLVNNIATIASNILTDLTVIASYLIIGFVIYGGYLYMFSFGDPGKAANGKKTLTNAFIGLGITISAYTIFSAIRIALIGNTSMDSCGAATTCVDPGTMVINLIQWVAGIGGVVAAIFIVIGGWGYMTSSGDANKLQKAKTTILYAIIGLLIVAFTEVITAFVSSTFQQANEVSFRNTDLITTNIKGDQNEIN